MPEKIFYYDLETTGLDNKKHGIHQLSAIIEVDGEIKEELSLQLKPFPGYMVNPQALDVSNTKIEALYTYPEEIEAYTTITNTLHKYCDKFNKTDKFHLCGFNNSSFDNQFLRSFKA